MLIDKIEIKVESEVLELCDMVLMMNLYIIIILNDWSVLGDVDVIVMVVGLEMLLCEDCMEEFVEISWLVVEIVLKIIVLGFKGIFVNIMNLCDVIMMFI